MVAPEVVVDALSATAPVPQRLPDTTLGVAGIVFMVAVTFLPGLVQPLNEAVVVYVVVLLMLGEYALPVARKVLPRYQLMLAPDVLLADSTTVPVPQRSPLTPVGVAGIFFVVAVTLLSPLVQPLREALTV
jgi:hypothetical protein